MGESGRGEGGSRREAYLQVVFWHSITPKGYYKKFCDIFWTAPPAKIHVVKSEGPHKEPHKKKEHREMVMMLLMWHQFSKNLFP